LENIIDIFCPKTKHILSKLISTKNVSYFLHLLALTDVTGCSKESNNHIKFIFSWGSKAFYCRSFSV